MCRLASRGACREEAWSCGLRCCLCSGKRRWCNLGEGSWRGLWRGVGCTDGGRFTRAYKCCWWWHVFSNVAPAWLVKAWLLTVLPARPLDAGALLGCLVQRGKAAPAPTAQAFAGIVACIGAGVSADLKAEVRPTVSSVLLFAMQLMPHTSLALCSFVLHNEVHRDARHWWLLSTACASGVHWRACRP